MRRSLTRIRTSHVGRLPPPKGWADMPARLAGAEITDPVVIAAKVTPAIAETVKKQVEAGIDCIGDGEFCVRLRMSGEQVLRRMAEQFVLGRLRDATRARFDAIMLAKSHN